MEEDNVATLHPKQPKRDADGVMKPSSLQGLLIPERRWIVRDWIPVGQTTSLYGDGGTGKSLLAQQLMTAAATEKSLLGLETEPCKAYGVFCEDDDEELSRRQEKINASLGIDFKDLDHMLWWSRVTHLNNDGIVSRYSRTPPNIPKEPIMPSQDCLFCNLPVERIVRESKHCLVIRDGYPVTNLHTLIIPKRHSDDYFGLSDDEKQDVWLQVETERSTMLDEDQSVTGFNVGFNSGEDAGQTVMHCHIHVIPRRVGDMDDPRGGVRGVIPDKRIY